MARRHTDSEVLTQLKDGLKRAHAERSADGETINLASDFQAPFARLKDGLKRADMELETLPPDVAAEVRNLQSIVNGSCYAERPIDEVIYFFGSDIGQVAIRGQQAVARHAMPPKPFVPFPFPEAGLPPSLLAEYRAGIAPVVTPKQDEGNGGAKIGDEITALEKNTPPLDRDSGKWVNNKRAAKIEGVETRTLADYRTQGIKNAASDLGRDKDGRVWRREGTPGSHPWYFRSTLRADSK